MDIDVTIQTEEDLLKEIKKLRDILDLYFYETDYYITDNISSICKKDLDYIRLYDSLNIILNN